MLKDVECIERSLLSDWQKLDALRTFVVPQVQFSLLTARVKKEAFAELDRELKRVAKDAMHLPQRASAEPVFLPPHKGGANILPLGDLADVGAVVHAFKVLTCPDPVVRTVAVASAKRTAGRLLGREASDEDLAAVLSGAPTPKGVHNASNIWSAARNASRRLAAKIVDFRWGWSPTLDRLQVHVPFPGREVEGAIVDAASRHLLHHKIRQGLQHRHLLNLIAKPDQGKVYEAASRDPASNHFHGAGQSMRACGHPDETTAHVLNHCFARHSIAINNRHRAVLRNVVEALPEPVRRNAKLERTVAGSGSDDKPDLVVIDEGLRTAVIVDVCCPFDKRYHALEVARRYKETKYQHLVDHLRGRGFAASAHAIVVGSLGSWDPANDAVLARRLFILPHAIKSLKRKCVSDVIRWSRDLYVEHVSQKRQFSENVTLPAL
ncbi:uncharacterized protein LOC117649892 [Thrips palmi]|uniref:Uncharacterized protein LOC117649892 n=1 Tax=Thrips palmi TaxID=161013 RepID=A0A6P8ZVJ9_THRPL|nr:uncharacterized protein LOC117649892 [Thrips palmi]